MSTHNIYFYGVLEKIISELVPATPDQVHCQIHDISNPWQLEEKGCIWVQHVNYTNIIEMTLIFMDFMAVQMPANHLQTE